VITIKEKETNDQLNEQAKARSVKRGFDKMMDMSAAATQIAREIGSSSDERIESAKAAIFDFETGEIRFVYAY
jgi:hypothetical protein